MSWRFHAPRELVFESYTAPEHVPHWWGPRGCTITILEMDARAGGVVPVSSAGWLDHLERIEYLEVLSRNGWYSFTGRSGTARSQERFT